MLVFQRFTGAVYRVCHLFLWGVGVCFIIIFFLLKSLVLLPSPFLLPPHPCCAVLFEILLAFF